MRSDMEQVIKVNVAAARVQRATLDPKAGTFHDQPKHEQVCAIPIRINLVRLP